MYASLIVGDEGAKTLKQMSDSFLGRDPKTVQCQNFALLNDRYKYQLTFCENRKPRIVFENWKQNLNWDIENYFPNF